MSPTDEREHPTRRTTPARPVRWREAMASALYGRDGFFVTPEAGPLAHFRTSVHASPLFTTALLRLIEIVDVALGRPQRLDVVDVGAGRGELLLGLARLAGPPIADRLRLTAVELAPRPADLPAQIQWRDAPPTGTVGVLIATEWLDNVPVEVAEKTPDGSWHYLLVDAADGTETLGERVSPADAQWLARWYPPMAPGARAEVGRYRDEAWAGAVASVSRGLALAVDYGHLHSGRPVDGTLTGFRSGRQVPPVPDGSTDLTAHVSMDSAAAAGSAASRRPEPAIAGPAIAGPAIARDGASGSGAMAYQLVGQGSALRRLGVDGGRPALELATSDPAAYVRALSRASAATELTDPSGLGGHWWLLQPVGVDVSLT